MKRGNTQLEDPSLSKNHVQNPNQKVVSSSSDAHAECISSKTKCPCWYNTRESQCFTILSMLGASQLEKCFCFQSQREFCNFTVETQVLISLISASQALSLISMLSFSQTLHVISRERDFIFFYKVACPQRGSRWE